MDELKRVSFIDEFVSEADESIFFSVPLVAAVFGKRKLAVSQDRVSIEQDTKFLQKFGAIQPPEVKNGTAPRVEALFASLSDELGDGRLKLEKEVPTLELIARRYTPAWLLISRLWTESGRDSGSLHTKAALLRYLETLPADVNDRRAAWQRLAELSRKERDWLGFVNAIVQTAELPDSSLATISSAVNTFNSVNRELEADPDQKRAFAKRLAAVMEPRLGECGATDCSRLGWLFLQIGNQNRAWEIAQCGLALDGENEYCRKLENKLSLEMAKPGPLFR